uniref:Uncharacterized protein n=1 Tax=Sphaerodactylus townsendi TaxID=933632 RepID=A0ACB8E7B4_9SAUR
MQRQVVCRAEVVYCDFKLLPSKTALGRAKHAPFIQFFPKARGKEAVPNPISTSKEGGSPLPRNTNRLQQKKTLKTQYGSSWSFMNGPWLIPAAGVISRSLVNPGEDKRENPVSSWHADNRVDVTRLHPLPEAGALRFL